MTQDYKRLRRQIEAEQLLGLSMPTLLFSVGLVVWLFQSNLGFVVGLAAGSATGLWAMFLILFRQNTIRLSWVMAVGLVLGYLGGALNTEIGLMRQGTNLAEYFGRSQSELSFAAVVVLWVCAGLLVAGGMFEPPLGVRIKRITDSDGWLVWMAIALVLFCFRTGYLVFDGMVESEGKHITVLGDFGAFFCEILPAMTVFLLGASKWRKRTSAVVLLASAELVLLIILGRRTLLYGMVVGCLAASLVGLRFHLSFVKKVFFAAAAVAIIYLGIPFFYAMREASWAMGGGDIPLRSLIPMAVDMLNDKDNNSLHDDLAENVRDRTSIILYLSDLLTASRVYPTLHGKDLLFSLQWAIPSVFYSNKETSAEEVLTNPQFGMVIEDDPNSLLTSGICDFGIIGCFAYPFVVVIAFRVLLGVLRSRLPEAAFIVALSGVVTLFFQAETGLPTFASTAREVVLIGLVITVVRKAPGMFDKKRKADRLLPMSAVVPGRPSPVQF